MLRPVLCLLTALTVAGCTRPGGEDGISSIRFGSGAREVGLARSNRDLAADFVELTFGLESGETLDGLLRYEGPVRVYLRSPGLAAYRRDLEALLERLRVEAGIDIAETRDPKQAQIAIEAVPSDQIGKAFPTAACFIVPGQTSWQDFLRGRPKSRLRWGDQQTLTHSVIFLPLDTTPQDVRDCLNEEITQALGPANDLYRLPDSVWNDDNFHGAVTVFDMTILRALYQPEFHSGMGRDEAGTTALKVLNRENPKGRSVPSRRRQPESQAWGSAIEVALSRSYQRNRRLDGARIATEIAAEMQPVDHRLGVSLLTLGRLSLRDDPARAAEYFSEAYRGFRREFGVNDVRTAQAGVHVAALALNSGQYDLAITLADRHVPGAIQGQNAILIAGLTSIKAEALLAKGDLKEAQRTRLDSLRWARYGFGDVNGDLAREQAQLAALTRFENQ